MDIIIKTVEEKFYVDSKGVEHKLHEMDSVHLINAFAKAIKLGDTRYDKIEAELKSEILRRIERD